MNLGPVPVTQMDAAAQHAAGDGHAWEPCAGCGADRGELCRHLGRRTFKEEALGLPRPTKKRPCANRAWKARANSEPTE